MGSTGKDRIVSIAQEASKNEATKNILKGVMRLKLANGVTFKTVEDYLIDDYNDNIEFDAAKLLPLLTDRVNQTEMNYKSGLNNLINAKFSDPLYSEQLPRNIDENGNVVTWSFIDVLKDKPIGAIDLENGTLKNGANTITVEDFYNVYKRSNVYNVKLHVQSMVSDIIYELSEKNNYNEDLIYENESLTTELFETKVNEFLNSKLPITKTNLESVIEETLTKNASVLVENNEVDKMEASIDNKAFIDPVDQVDEIKLDGFGPTTDRLSLLDSNERLAVANEPIISYNDQKKIEEIVNAPKPIVAGDEDEEVTVDEPEFIEVQVEDQQAPIVMMSK